MRLTLVLGLLTVWAPAAAQTVSSPGPDQVAVTVYRDIGRGNNPPRLQWLNGYALISEQRQVRIPAGTSELRFEGVAGGIIPQSAIVSGLPEGTIERNRDAYLLSPGTLLDRSLGRRVHLKRTDSATGKVREEEAVIRSGADGAVVLQTAEGIEALRCAGKAETIVYPQVPAGLSPKPTLSVRTRSRQPIETTLTLSYLASGFDWQANYIVQLSPDATHAKLFAWLTLASNDETSFRQARTSAVAGRLNREAADVLRAESRPVRLECWPYATTSDVPAVEPPPPPASMMAPPPPPPPPSPERGGEEIIVTGARLKAEQDDLGDVKLYRIPELVTVAANSQKQIAMIEQPSVKLATVYRSRIDAYQDGYDGAATRYLVTRNRRAEGLGLPLPAGSVAIFAKGEGRLLLIGEGDVDDLAIGEDVEISAGEAPGVRVRITKADKERYELVVSNDASHAIRYEAEFSSGDDKLSADDRLEQRNGRPLWRVDVPPNASRTLTYRPAD